MFGASGGRVLTAATGSFALTGVAAALRPAWKLISAAGSFAETGVAATLTKASIGAGGDAAPLPSMGLLFINDPTRKVLFAANGVFTLTGNAAAVTKGRALQSAVGTFVLNGAPALRDMQVTADKATFAFTGVAAALSRASQGVTANTGSFALTGNPAGLVYQTATGRTLAASFGQFILTGNDATLPTQIARKIVADTGAFAVTGNAAIFIAVHWAPQSPPGSTWTDVAGSSTTWTPV